MAVFIEAPGGEFTLLRTPVSVRHREQLFACLWSETFTPVPYKVSAAKPCTQPPAHSSAHQPLPFPVSPSPAPPLTMASGPCKPLPFLPALCLPAGVHVL